ELAGQPVPFAEDRLDRGLKAVEVLERDLGGRQAELVDVVWKLRLRHLCDELGVAHQVSDPQAGHAHRLRKGSCDQEARMPLEQLEPALTAEFEIGFVEQDMAREALEDARQILEAE